MAALTSCFGQRHETSYQNSSMHVLLSTLCASLSDRRFQVHCMRKLFFFPAIISPPCAKRARTLMNVFEIIVHIYGARA